ncbi:hypothetical protein HYV82_05625 [Candidatus Woesearchaeota archaeon]|nr:hypothetical protein [Candidatus Woesearchaeota archaeon]
MNQRIKHLGSAVLNIALRLAIAYFLIEAILLPNDPRFAGKAIPIRNLIIVGGLSMLFPALWWIRNKANGRKAKAKAEYPFGTDILYLSIFALDMAGNSFNLYDTVNGFDLLAHFHGTGALAAVLLLIFSARKASGRINFTGKEFLLLAIGMATIVHVALEAQEYYTDVFAGTHNVGGISDTINDLIAGLIGSFTYAAAAKAISPRIRRIRQPQASFRT